MYRTLRQSAHNLACFFRTEMSGFCVDYKHLRVFFCKMMRLSGQDLGRDAARGKAHPGVQRTGKIIRKNQQAKHVSSSFSGYCQGMVSLCEIAAEIARKNAEKVFQFDTVFLLNLSRSI